MHIDMKGIKVVPEMIEHLLNDAVNVWVVIVLYGLPLYLIRE